MSEEEIIKDIKETNYNEENVEELLYELENDTGTYSCYDNAMAIIYYKNLYKQTKKELNNLKEIEKSHQEENGKLRVEYEKVYEDNLTLAHELEQEKEKNKEYEKQLDLDYVDKNYISKDKIKELLENEIIDISGFRCIAVEDIEYLLEGK